MRCAYKVGGYVATVGWPGHPLRRGVREHCIELRNIWECLAVDLVDIEAGIMLARGMLALRSASSGLPNASRELRNNASPGVSPQSARVRSPLSIAPNQVSPRQALARGVARRRYQGPRRNGRYADIPSHPKLVPLPEWPRVFLTVTVALQGRPTSASAPSSPHLIGRQAGDDVPYFPKLPGHLRRRHSSARIRMTACILQMIHERQRTRSMRFPLPLRRKQ